MRDELKYYYEHELGYLRQIGTEFAKKYPGAASRLALEPTRCSDPHVERLLEAFAFLAARIHLKLDDEFPEITEALLGVIYPHFIRPIPSMAIVDLQIDSEQGKLSSGWPIKKGTMLYSRPVDQIPCKFSTCYDTVLWPLVVTGANTTTPDRLQPSIKASDASAAIRVEVRCAPDAKLPQLKVVKPGRDGRDEEQPFDSVRFYLHGNPDFVNTLYELLCSRLVGIAVRDPTPNSKVKPVVLPPESLRPVGFEQDQGMLPYTRRSFIGYRLLQEFFSFPEKFFFLDISGLKDIWKAGYNDRFELVFLLSDFNGEVRRNRITTWMSPSTFRLSCVPIVNLFPFKAEPIPLNQLTFEYPLTLDSRRPNANEVFSVDEVLSATPDSGEPQVFHPFYSVHGSNSDSKQCYWIANRRSSTRVNDSGTEMFLSLVDRSNRPVKPDADTLVVRTTCTNRDIPARLPFGSEDWDFELEGNSPIKRIVSLRKPTPTVRPPLGKNALWHLVSHLALNHLSLVEEGKDALKQILKLYNFTEDPFSNQMIEGVTALNSGQEIARIVSDVGISFARGWRVELELDEEPFVGGGYYLFASVIEHFLGMYASLNSFSQLVLRTRQQKEVVREWAPRAGSKILM